MHVENQHGNFMGNALDIVIRINISVVFGTIIEQ